MTGCQLVSSCTNVQEKSHLRTLLDHNFRRHYKTNKAPLSLSFNPSWLVQNPDFVQVIEDWMDSVLATYKDVYFTTDFQLILWMMNPISSSNMAVGLLVYQSKRDNICPLRVLKSSRRSAWWKGSPTASVPTCVL